MKDIKSLYEKCNKMLEDIGIHTNPILDVQVNTRAKKRWGQCKKTPYGFIIQISARLLQDDVSDMAAENTMLHELLHACDGCFDHGYHWKRLAEKVNNTYGYNVKRTASCEEYGVKVEREPERINYKFVCEGCGQVITRSRASKFTRNYSNYICGICSGKFRRVA